MTDSASILGALSVCPATLVNHDPEAARRWLDALYAHYKEPLSDVCKDAAKIREGMLKRGCTCDFGDREGELLYMLVRKLKPEVVVEISPCHGYSTGYILKALTDNECGICHSYEICESHLGDTIHSVISNNLPKGVDRDRWVLHVGDARKQDIPEADFLFIDSSHSVTFSAWYYGTLIPKARQLVMVHDILIPYGKENRVPKAAFLGVNEQYFLLQALAEDDRKCFAAADMAGMFKDHLHMFTNRHGLDIGAMERSVVFEPVTPGAASSRLIDAANMLQNAYEAHVNGNRLGAVKLIHDASFDTEMPLFGKLLLAQLLPAMGYKRALAEDVYPAITLDPSCITVSELMAAFELMGLNGDFNGIEGLLDEVTGGALDPVVDYVRKRGFVPLRGGSKNWFGK